MGLSGLCWPLTEALDFAGGQEQPPTPTLGSVCWMSGPQQWLCLAGTGRSQCVKAVIQGHFAGAAPSGNADCEAVNRESLKEAAEHLA